MTISAPVLVTLIALLLIAAVLAFVFTDPFKILQNAPTATVTSTPTPPPTFTPTITPTDTPLPTPTPLPPLDYTVQPGDTCIGLAAHYDVSVSIIIEMNGLGINCLLFPNQQLKIPQPTPTASPPATSTLSSVDATAAAIPTVTYTVKEGDTLSTIARNYNVSPDTIKAANNMTSDVVFSGQVLVIPLVRLATPGPTPTHTPPPPYPAPVLLLPQDGASFTSADATITLQWSAVAELRENETYQVTVEDVTANAAQRLVQYTTSTRIIIPETFRPPSGESHLYRWWVLPVRTTGATANGETRYESAGATSAQRGFIWAAKP